MSSAHSNLEKIVPLSCVALSLLLLSPLTGNALSLSTVIFIHAIGYLSLGIFFEIPELSLNLLCIAWAKRSKILNFQRSTLIGILKARYVLTHFVGPVAGILSIFSGIYVTFRTGYSFKQGWVFWLLAFSIVGLYKGLLQHNTYLKRLLKATEESADETILRHNILSPFDQSLIFLELPTYLFSFWAASFKPELINPLIGIIGPFEGKTTVWTTGICMLILGSLLLIPLRLSMNKWSRLDLIRR